MCAFWRFGACWFAVRNNFGEYWFQSSFIKNEENIKTVSQGKMPFVEYGAESSLKKP